MPAKSRRKGNISEKRAKAFLESLGFIVQPKAPDTRFIHNEIYGCFDGIAYDPHADSFFCYQVKTKTDRSVNSTIREFREKVLEAFSKVPERILILFVDEESLDLYKSTREGEFIKLSSNPIDKEGRSIV